MGQARLKTGPILADAWRLYRMLWRRSIVTTLVVLTPYSVYLLLSFDHGVSWPIDVVVTLVGPAIGPALVQGALILTVQDLHRGERPRGIVQMIGDTLPKLLRLVAASILYFFGVFFGLFLLLVPGLYAAGRWALWAPMIMLKNLKLGEARFRSSKAVNGRTWATLRPLIVVMVISQAPPALVWFLADPTRLQQLLAASCWAVLTTPFHAHVLNVLYYRLVERKAVVHKSVATWRSIWAGA